MTGTDQYSRLRTPQLAGGAAHYREPASWFDLESQDYWFETIEAASR
jgi:hypothetical protein